ncbi:hypothetical protein MAR_018817 [Mya arenaria]|uniref:Uncharacterized protein n=1 Tax=Mya arenaria TaxID=6604 RepID=A0ABY7EIK7_MYAAR|nr:uncharacterized protein LOC128238274 [Mya arenaria]XP_052809970.1 uncharacterized protein LOC128238274 [Mya arenaria]XP_052809971.1 uncharacterized protein LOC128238274 [Mya arenaria]WAR08859.1 hypothetical protein MAR_018817 [Mya arenaria]
MADGGYDEVSGKLRDFQMRQESESVVIQTREELDTTAIDVVVSARNEMKAESGSVVIQTRQELDTVAIDVVDSARNEMKEEAKTIVHGVKMEMSMLQNSAPPTNQPQYIHKGTDTDNSIAHGLNDNFAILNDQSLLTLAQVISPNELDTLLIYLDVPVPLVKSHKANHPGDIVGAHFLCLKYWRDKHRGNNQTRFRDLTESLGDIGQNDIIATLNSVFGGKVTSRSLRRQDFGHT